MISIFEQLSVTDDFVFFTELVYNGGLQLNRVTNALIKTYIQLIKAVLRSYAYRDWLFLK